MDARRDWGHAVVKLYVEGGGDAAALKTACREGFAKFLQKAGLAGQMPRVVACGSRNDAYDSFCTAIAQGEPAFLLVDSEAPVAKAAQQGQPLDWKPWLHLKQRQGDGWDKPKGSEDLQCHLMVQCMETWLIADPQAMQAFFGQGFKADALPGSASTLEAVGKQKIFTALTQATRSSKTKGVYGKAEHSFKLLACIDPAKVAQASPWAKRLFDALKKDNKA